ncbi:hypothetical protein MYK68_06960 [Gordonia sp. PP30]|uniref:hypothetical protein n=1 Tax=Gordonia sp. PP30 TaxID=2935861 RepID=UPI001FFF8380|nr:hypothetical protein [Gordonia sp. PP30]UQE76314.1 hypothetical protein MYK68_06960 [Gordonia sp. PP30]
MTQAEVAGRINTVKKAHAFLDWTQFQGALVIYDQVAAKAAAEAVEDAGRAAHKLLDVDAQVILCLAQYVEGTEHQGRCSTMRSPPATGFPGVRCCCGTGFWTGDGSTNWSWRSSW